MYVELCEFFRENKVVIVVFIAIVISCVAGAWLAYDYGRNEPVYHHTDDTMGNVDKRIESIEQRIDSLQSRVSKAEKTVSGTVVTIRQSRENAVTVADGISAAEERLDGIIQRQGRIENIIADIENANRQRTQGSQAANMAK